MLLETVGASLSENILTSKVRIRAGQGKIKPGENI